MRVCPGNNIEIKAKIGGGCFDIKVGVAGTVSFHHDGLAHALDNLFAKGIVNINDGAAPSISKSSITAALRQNSHPYYGDDPDGRGLG